MKKYESKVQIPPVAGAQKPGVERYALPGKLADELQKELPAEEVAGAEWVDGPKMKVSIASETPISDPDLKDARTAVQKIVGPSVDVAPFVPDDEDQPKTS